MSDYWYDNRDKLKSGMMFVLEDGDRVVLDRRVPGDGTRWYAANVVSGKLFFEDYEVEPGDLATLLED